MADMSVLRVIQEARRCEICADALPFAPRPLLAGSATARVLIIGQAPGSAAHESGVPWDDRSGERLRAWLGLGGDVFYDPTRVALMPMGFCYPGKGRGGDLAPRAECAPLWHDRILKALTGVRLTVYVGRYAFERYLSSDFSALTAAVRAADALLPKRAALPHPSGRNNLWLAKNPWFEMDVLPRVRKRVRSALRA